MIEDLEVGLPGYINLGTINNAEGSDREERRDLHQLRMALVQNGYNINTVSRNNTLMVHADHWEEYAREWACDHLLVGGLDGTFSEVVDWPRWAAKMRIDWRPVEVPGDGRFAGTWYIR